MSYDQQIVHFGLHFINDIAGKSFYMENNYSSDYIDLHTLSIKKKKIHNYKYKSILIV